MERNSEKYSTYCQILKEELIPAMGCTEPIALAYATAKGREALGKLPERVVLQISGSIIKNVKSVIVPHTNKLKGIPAAAAVGIVAGRADKELEVISDVNDQDIEELNDYLNRVKIDVEFLDSGHVFDIIATEYAGEDWSRVHIQDFHTNVVLVEKNGEVLYKGEDTGVDFAQHADRSLLNMEDIWDFANTVEISDVKEVLERQIRYNTAIAEEGLIGNYGANIGSVLLRSFGHQDVLTRAKARAAAASDARMNGCELPVVINSGSGNQGITVSVPVIEYAKEYHSGNEKLYRALVLSNLVSIHEKSGIGTLSAYCGAVSAGAGAGAGIVYLSGGDYDAVKHTVVNALAIVSGIVCDGAKASCAAKISSSIDAAVMGYNMYKLGQEFKGGDGIVMSDIESTIRGIGRLGKDGMAETNKEIIRLMIGR